MKIVRVPLGKRSYPIYIGRNILPQIGEFFKKHTLPSHVVLITDRTVAQYVLQPVKKSLSKSGFSVQAIILSDGEKQKSLAVCNTIFTQLLQWKIPRNSVIAALGGGVIGDLAGFIAATYQRGVHFVQIPTSLLAQVDSSVGGKVGVNHPLAKNMIGAFYQPKFVFADSSVLHTLPTREIICGLGEIVKYGIIMQAQFFSTVQKTINRALQKDTELLASFVERSCALKAYVVSRDEKESGLRAILNFGHTVGHALEQAGKYRTLKHGEAIFYGMAAEAFIAHKMTLLSLEQFQQIEVLIKRIPLPSLKKIPLHSAVLLSAMKNDKKATRDAIRMVLPTQIGKTTLPIPVQPKVIVESIRYLKQTF